MFIRKPVHKTLNSYRLILLLSLILFIPTFVSWNANATPDIEDGLEVKVGFYVNPPKIFKDENDQITGFFPELLKYIAEQEKWTLSYLNGSWSECLDWLDSGAIDIMLDVGYDEERALKYNFSVENVLSGWAHIYTLENSTINTFEDLQNKKISVMENDINYVGPHGFLNISTIFKLNCTFIEYPDLLSVFDSIENGTADAGVANGLFGNRYAYLYNIQKTIISFNYVDFKFAFPKNGTMTSFLLPIIDSWIQDLKLDQNSKYYDLYNEFLAPIEKSDSSIPVWLDYLLIGLISTAFLFLGASILFRNQVNRKTEQLRNINNQLQSISDNLVNGFVYQIDRSIDTSARKFLYISAGVEKILGIKTIDVYKDPWVMYGPIHPDDSQNFIQEEEAVKTAFLEKNRGKEKPVFFIEARFIHSDGSIRWLQIASTPHYGEEGHIVWDGVALDITDQKKAEAKEIKLLGELHQSQKLDAIGQLAGGIAHDFNNSLASILGLIELLKSGCTPEEQKNYLEMIFSVAKKAGELTQNLLTFARKETKINKLVNFEKLVVDTVTLLKHTIDKSIRISVENSAKNTFIRGDESLLQNALMNIGINASQAMPNGGFLHFNMQNFTLDEKYCKSSPFKLEPGIFLTISISDTGCGIPREIISRIYEPFFTTKKKKKGTGLGLALVYSIVKSHKGAIQVESQVNVGTVFHIFLPISHDNLSEISSDKPQQLNYINKKINGKIILLVEDEEVVRLVVSSELKQVGYQVICAENGQIGVDIFKERKDEIDLIILDINMPVLGGKEALKQIRTIDSRIPIIISSGYIKKEDFAEMQSIGVDDVLYKPFDKNALLELIERWISLNHKKRSI